MSEHPEELPEDTDRFHALLLDTNDYTHRIHWWVRLFGVTWLVGIACALLFAAIAVGQSSGGSYSDCIDAGHSAAYCINN